MSALVALATDYGILPEFRDLGGTTRPTAPETMRALLRAHGVEANTEAQARAALAERKTHPPTDEWVVPSDTSMALPCGDGEWWLTMEDGTEKEGRATLPPLPPGIHSILVTGRQRTRLITAPATCPSVETITGQGRVWGLNAALYGLRSTEGGGIGDFDALGTAAEAAAQNGADFLGINPVHSLGWADHDTISPYSPSHRGFLNTLHIHVPGKTQDTSDQIAYSRVMDDQRRALETTYRTFEGHAEFEVFCAERGDALSTFARYEALSEILGPDWRHWPADLPTPDPARIRFHQWLQWQADGQLARAQERARGAGMGLGLYLDLAVGPRRGGAESWCEAGAIAKGVSLGAPPDHLGPDGQNWQLAAYAPEKLAALDYAPLRRIMRETMRHAGVLRIDHVLGMNRSYWIPDDGSPGGYTRQPMKALLAIVAIEAAKAKTVIIGEDLGLVPEGFRETLQKRGLYGYSVLQYERDKSGMLRDPATLRPHSLLCFGTHDTPTLKGFWNGCDIGWWQRLGWIDGKQARKVQKERKADRQTLGGNAPYSQAKRQVHHAMAASPAAMVAIQLDDVADHEEAQNLPGTVTEHPNWQRRYTVPVEHLASDPAFVALSAAMCEGRAIKRDERKQT